MKIKDVTDFAISHYLDDFDGKFDDMVFVRGTKLLSMFAVPDIKLIDKGKMYYQIAEQMRGNIAIGELKYMAHMAKVWINDDERRIEGIVCVLINIETRAETIAVFEIIHSGNSVDLIEVDNNNNFKFGSETMTDKFLEGWFA